MIKGALKARFNSHVDELRSAVRAGFAQRAQKPIAVVMKDCFAPIAAVEQVIKGAKELERGFPAHKPSQITRLARLPSSPDCRDWTFR